MNNSKPVLDNSETVYREILQKSLNRITDEIILLETQNSKLLNIVTNSNKRLERLRLEQEQIRQELKGRMDTNQTKVDGIATEFIDDRIAVHQAFMNRIKEQGLDPSEFAFAIGGWVTSYCLEKKGKRM